MQRSEAARAACLALGIVVAGSSAACRKTPRSVTTMAATCVPGGPLASAPIGAAHDANDLTFTLYRSTSCKAENMAVSGFVVRHALGTLAAATPARAAIWRSLGYGGGDQPGRAELDAWKVAAGNLAYTSGARVFYESSLHLDPAFEMQSGTAFGQTFEALDFKRRPEKTRERIGAWVAQATGGQLRGALPKELVGDEAVLVVGTAFGIEGPWQTPFNPEITKEEPFTLRNGSTRRVPMMSQLIPAEYGELDGVQLVDLQLGAFDGRLSVLFVLPALGTTLETIERKLDRATYDGWLSRLRGSAVHCAIPRFKAETLLDVTPAVTALTGTEIDSTRVFSDVAKGAPLKLVHQVSVTVDEGGVKAAASSAGTYSTAVEHETIPSFVADRPFLFVIRDRQSPGSPVLLIGRVGNPQSESAR